MWQYLHSHLKGVPSPPEVPESERVHVVCGPVGGVRGVWPRARGLVRRQVPAQADAARPDEGPLPRGRRSSSCARRLLIRRSSE